MGTVQGIAMIVALGLVAAGCGTDVTQTDEYQELESQRAAVAAERDGLEDSLAAAKDQATELESALADREDELQAVTQELAGARDELEQIRLKYDDEIRAELQAALNAEVDRACEAAKEDIDAPISRLVRFDADWAPISSTSELIAAVEDCAAAERAKTAEQREAERLAACTTIDVDAVVKDPDNYAGECLILHAAIWQYDSRTGPCGFMAAMSSSSHQYRYEYGDDGVFSSTNDASCPQLDGIDADDHIKVWATGLGPYRYDTASGGTNEIPAWKIEKVELVRKG